jgi:hypothetical protein
VLNLVTDTRVFAGCVTGRREWPLVPAAARSPPAPRLRCATSSCSSPSMSTMRSAGAAHGTRARGGHAAFMGLNRAQAAVVEGAVLVSRLHMLALEKIDSEMAYLQIAIDKTAGAGEHEAWGWLRRRWRRIARGGA